MIAHELSHSVCEQYDKTLKNEEIRKKHISMLHENIKIFCHYFNNSTVCPFDEECVFLHQISPVCKYGIMCARDKCMFRHEETAVVDVLEKDDDAVKTVEDKNDGNISADLDKEPAEDVKDDIEYIKEVAIVHVDNDVDEIMVDSAYEVSENVTSSDDETNDKDIEQNDYEEERTVSEYDKNEKQVDVTTNETNPSQPVKNTNLAKLLVCKQCGFEARTKEDMKLHKLNAHNWCSSCFSTFIREEELTKHISKMHMEKS